MTDTVPFGVGVVSVKQKGHMQIFDLDFVQLSAVGF